MEEVNNNIAAIIGKNIPEGKKALQDSHKSLSEIADYCEGKYISVNNTYKSNGKQKALEETRTVFNETKQYATQSLASVAYQIHALAASVLDLLDNQANQLNQMNSDISYISQVVHVHKEKVARREIGVLASSKNTTRGHKIIAPGQREQPKRYQRAPIDYTALDSVGHGMQSAQSEPSRSASVRSNRSASSSGSPTTKTPPPPTAPKAVISGTLRVRKNTQSSAPPPAPEIPRVPNGPPPKPTVPKHIPAAPSDLPPPPPPPPVLPEPTSGPTSPEPPPPPPLSPSHDMPPVPDLLPSPPSPFGYSGGTSRPGEQSPFPPPPPPPALPDDTYDVPPTALPSPPSLPSWVPETYDEKVISIYDYDASRDDELSFKEGEIIYVLKKNTDGWYEGVMNGMTGLFPGNYVEAAP